MICFMGTAIVRVIVLRVRVRVLGLRFTVRIYRSRIRFRVMDRVRVLRLRG